MKVGLSTFGELYAKGLDTLRNILEKGAAFAEEQGASSEDMLGWSLAPDMFPLRRQAQIVISFAQQWALRAAGLQVPATLEGESSLEDLYDAIAAAKDQLATLSPELFEGRDDVMLTMSIGTIEPTMPLGQWVSGFATTNFYFHLTIAYAILRARGVPLGKPDMFGGGL